MKPIEWIELGGMVTALCLLVFSVASYFGSVEQDRQLQAGATSLDYGRLFSDELQKELSQLRVWVIHYAMHGDINDPAVVPPESFEALAEEILFGQDSNGENTGTHYVYLFEKMNDFYLNISACYDSEACDKAVLTRLLCAPARRFSHANQRVIEYYKSHFSGDQYGDGIDTFLGYCPRGINH